METRDKCKRPPVPVNESLVTECYQLQVSPIAKAIGRGSIVKVIIRNPFTTPAGAPNAQEVRVGSATGQYYDLLPGANTPDWYAEDLKDVYIKSLTLPTNVMVIAYTRYYSEAE